MATLAGAMAFVLALLVTAPGDPVDLIPNGAELRPQLEVEWGLDQPAPVRFVRFARRLVLLDWGQSLSYRPGARVWDVVQGPAASSVGLAAAGLGFALLWGTGLAFVTVRGQRRVRLAVQAGSIIPLFLLAHGLVTVFNESAFALMEEGLIARPEWFALPDQPSLLRTTMAIVLLAVASGTLAETHAQIHDALARIESSPYIDAARARGAPLWPHIWRNLIPELAATASERVAFVVGGVVIAEKVLLLNGLGAVLWEAAKLRDYDLALVIALLSAAFVGSIRVGAEVVRVSLDPRLRENA
ncbi:MAG: ABC transporter permease [Myxococcota bacterium]